MFDCNVLQGLNHQAEQREKAKTRKRSAEETAELRRRVGLTSASDLDLIEQSRKYDKYFNL